MPVNISPKIEALKYLCFSDDLFDIIDLSQKIFIAVCAGGRGHFFPPSGSVTIPSGDYIDNICVLKKVSLHVSPLLVHEIYYSR